MGFNLRYWTPISGSYFLYGSILEKFGNFWKNGHFSRPDWRNTTWADMARLGSIGLIKDDLVSHKLHLSCCMGRGKEQS